MNKKIIVSCLMMVPFFIAADDNQPLVILPADAKTVTYKITLYRDEQKYDEAAWNKVVTNASKAIERARDLEHDANAATNEIVDAFVNAIEEIYIQNSAGAEGVHGQLSIDISDDQVD